VGVRGCARETRPVLIGKRSVGVGGCARETRSVLIGKRSAGKKSAGVVP
jgi:hypothetical protein